jgi:hypothetical protein
VPVCCGFLPKSVNIRLAAFLRYLRKAYRFSLKELHDSAVNGAPGGRAPPQKKSARELRQGGSDYRCCIPALAGFVSPQSIAPDGDQIFLQHWHRARPTAFVEEAVTLTSCDASVCIDAVRWFAPLLLVFFFATVNSCTTLVNRRDLYSPEPGPDSLEAARQWYGVTTTRTTATTTRSEETLPPAGARRF